MINYESFEEHYNDEILMIDIIKKKGGTSVMFPETYEEILAYYHKKLEEDSDFADLIMNFEEHRDENIETDDEKVAAILAYSKTEGVY